MAVPITALAAMLLGGGMAAQEVSSIRGAKREEEQAALEQQRKLDFEAYKSRLKAQEAQKESQMKWDKTQEFIKANPQLGINLPPRPVTEEEFMEAAFATEVGGKISETLNQRSTQDPVRYESEAQGVTPKTAQNQAVDAPETIPGIPQSFFTVNISKGGELSLQIKQNEDFHKQAINKQATELYQQEFEANRHLGPMKATQAAKLKVLETFGITDNYDELVDVFKDATPEQKSNFAYKNLIARITDPNFTGSWPDLREELSTTYPFSDLKDSDWQAIHRDAYNAIRLANYPAARQMVKNDFPDLDPQSEEFKENAEIYASRLASGIVGSPSAAEGRRTQRWKEEVLKREAAARKLGTLAEEQAYAASLLLPDIDEITAYATALNTTEGARIFLTKAGLNVAAWLQWGAGKTVEIEGIGERDIGVAAKYYQDKVQKYLATFARIFGERGVLTEEDVRRAAKTFANLGDSAQLTKDKAEDMRRHFEDMQSRDPLAYQQKGGTIRAQQNNVAAYEKLVKDVLGDKYPTGGMGDVNLDGLFQKAFGSKKEKD